MAELHTRERDRSLRPFRSAHTRGGENSSSRTQQDPHNNTSAGTPPLFTPGIRPAACTGYRVCCTRHNGSDGMCVDAACPPFSLSLHNSLSVYPAHAVGKA